MKKIAKSFFRKGDLLIYFFIFFVTSLPFILTGVLKITGNIHESLSIEINYNGTHYLYSLEEDREIRFKNDRIIVEIKDKKVRVKESDCPDKLCMKRGWIDKPGQFIICMPNKLIVKVIGKEEYDSITY
ncbi:MAG: NusG domain II-containing protein [Spirochaetales bacterium]|jgi:hypothetical protein|nr:NusG domain II-containing protein [Exilispira sp.]NMC66959.1 NusG domain II-containing protein [Spirochaetales bacterium]